MSLRSYKFLVQPVLQQVDDDGNVVAEVSGREPDVVFGTEGLLAYLEQFPETLARVQARLAAEQNGAGIPA